ncbi:molybdopterin molybdotransferase MoeA [Fulvivirgaceae bacterium BMA12]|uniref:Molybdopterin molybdenumtransferase n=1 Tax=Agaribacillus aureus TaxID=3051825 RepID=A0ABT8LGN5_9BACT|nr:molybdopterin molybdotransferase MoeA [Fulvivirgaceae bacterium BMA12]
MITVEEAQNILLSHQLPLKVEALPLDQCYGKVLQEDLFADRDFPPYNRVTMDGIAIDHASFSTGQRVMNIEGVAPAGAPQLSLEDRHACLEVMTGAILPSGTDTVIRYEDIQTEGGQATIQEENIVQGQNIHYQGEDRSAGDLIVNKGTVISAAEIGICATIGKSVVKTSQLPKVMVISTGDELVDIQETPEAHQIRRSNVYRTVSTLGELGITADTAHLPDDKEEIRRRLSGFLESYEVIMLSGGVSKGKFDFLPTVLASLGVQKLFHKIKQRPGKPFWFGTHPGGSVVFALPGNPISSFMCMQAYFIPWLNHSLGRSNYDLPHAILSESIQFKPDMVYFAQVKITFSRDGRLLALPIEGHGSGDLANLVDADGFLQLPRGKDEFEAGEAYPLILFR